LAKIFLALQTLHKLTVFTKLTLQTLIPVFKDRSRSSGLSDL